MKTDSFFDIKLDKLSKLSRVQNFMYFHSNRNYVIEVHEYPSGQFIGYIEATTKSNESFLPSNASSLKECIQQLVDEVSKKKSVNEFNTVK